jgi:hypothetical protein
MEAYIEEVRKLEERFDGLQTEHIPRAENIIADHLSKCMAQKLLVEPGIFVLHLTQPSVSPSTMARKRRKLDSGKYLLAEPPETPGRDVARNNSAPHSEQQPPSKPQVVAVEMSAHADGEMPLVLVVKPQTPTWARHIVHYLQT